MRADMRIAPARVLAAVAGLRHRTAGDRRAMWGDLDRMPRCPIVYHNALDIV